MSRYPLNLPADLHQAAAKIAQQQGISLNQFILWSVAEKVGELRRSLDDPTFPGIAYRVGCVAPTDTGDPGHRHSRPDDRDRDDSVGAFGRPGRGGLRPERASGG